MSSRLTNMQARFQEKQLKEREEKLLNLYESHQQKTFEKVSRSSAGSNTSLSSTGGGKVRQLFDERRQKAGIDRSYPLEPLKNAKVTTVGRNSKQTKTRTTSIKSTTLKNINQNQKITNNNKNTNNKDEKITNTQFDSTFNKSQIELVRMLNNHNLNDLLDNEEIPSLDHIDSNEGYITQKLSNLGGKLPSETAAVTEKLESNEESPLGKTFSKENKRVFARSIKPTIASENSESTSVVPSRAKSQTMQATTKPLGSKKASTVKNIESNRAPCNDRPSAKQNPKSPVTRDDLTECKYCNRRFATDRLEVHEVICGKTAKKKRKIYDATKHRIEGTEMQPYIRKGKKSLSQPKTASKKDWRQTHTEFIEAIRAAKMTQAHLAKGGKLSDLPPPPPSSNPDYVQCPHCGRKFNESAAERHIPKCASYSFNKPKQSAASNKKSIAGRK